MTDAPRARLALVGAALLTAMSSAGAQSASRPGWLPRQVNIRSVTPAQRATAIARLEAVERLLLKVPGLAEPKGFEILPKFHGGSRQIGPSDTPLPNSVVEYTLTLMFFAPSKKIAGEGCDCLWVTINRQAPSGLRDATGRTIYIETERGAPVPPALQVYRALSEERITSSTSLLFASADALPWTIVSRQEAYDAVRFDWEGVHGEKMAEFRASLSKSRYQVWMEGAEERNKQREQTVATAARIRGAAEADEFQRSIEKTDREVTEQLKADESEDRERNQATLAASYSRTKALATELAAMTAAERAMPALVDYALTEGPIATGWRMTSVDTPKSWRLLAPNYDFWRARASVVEVRNVEVTIAASGTGLSPAVHPVLLQAFRTLDWAGFNRLLAEPR